MYKLIDLPCHSRPDQGALAFFEAGKDLDFEIRRIYYIFDVPVGVKRGMHAHKELRQALWCPYGAIELELDNGAEQKHILLDRPNLLLIPDLGVWRNMYWRQRGSVLCVAASDHYFESDYIRNYDEFLDYVRRGYWHGN